MVVVSLVRVLWRELIVQGVPIGRTTQEDEARLRVVVPTTKRILWRCPLFHVNDKDR